MQASPSIQKLMLQNPQFFLNTALCQFPPRASKTEKAIIYLKHVSLNARINNGPIENGIHHMTVVFTNNNLLETKNWKLRLNRKTENMNIFSLSSKRDSDFNNLPQIESKLLRAKSANDLPDIITMCTHGSRTDDIYNLITTLQNSNLDFSRIGIKQITLTLMFDEADKNIKLITEFIKEFNTFMATTVNYTVRDIHFITATACIPFLKKLKRVNIRTLKNINKMIENSGRINISHEELLKDYRKLADHTHRSDIDNMTLSTVAYAKIVLNKILIEREQSGDTTQRIIFAPAEMEISSHNSMCQVFTEKKFSVLILNSEKQNNSVAKGFINADGSYVSLDDFNARHNISGEIYDTLAKWTEINSTTDLAITGYLNVERGVTFNSIGFNFTDMIVSAYHLKNLASLIQIIGRANGGVEYVKIMNIWAPKHVINEANEFIEMMNELHARDPEEYNEADFRKKTVRDIIKKAATVPKAVSLTEDEWITATTKKGIRYNKDAILGLIEKYEPITAKILKDETMKQKQITLPTDKKKKATTKKSSKEKHITDALSAMNRNETFVVDLTEDEKKTDCYQIFLDEEHKQMIISIYYGKRVKADLEKIEKEKEVAAIEESTENTFTEEA